MSKLPAGYFHKRVSMKEAGIDWPEKSVAMIPYTKGDKQLMRIIDAGHIIVKTMDQYFTEFNINRKAGRLFTHIGSGIGDILALSALTEYLEPIPIQVHAPKSKHPVFDWFRTPVDVRDYFDPIAYNFTPQNRLLKFKNLHRLVIENAAIEAREGCWYDAHFKRIGLHSAPEDYNRPQLRTDRISQEKTWMEGKSLIICHRASCQMRSSNLEDFYTPIRKVYPDYRIYVHETDLTDTDKRFIEKVQDISVLPACPVKYYLLNLYDADMVVSVDSAAIHFREGIEKPALGVFGAMTTGSRTSGYKFTSSFNVKSTCEHQPCFIHERIKGQVCLNAKEGDRVAKCQTGKSFQKQLEQQLYGYTTAQNSI